MHLDVVRVRIAALVVAVGDDHLRALLADDRDQSPDGLVHRRHVERLRVVVRLGVDHAGVAVAEHRDPVEADDLAPTRSSSGRSSASFAFSCSGVRPWKGCPLAQRRVLEVTLLAARAAHEHRAHALRLYIAHVGAPFDASSSGWAWTVMRHRCCSSSSADTLSTRAAA